MYTFIERKKTKKNAYVAVLDRGPFEHKFVRLIY